jgi:hypothetical protein
MSGLSANKFGALRASHAAVPSHEAQVCHVPESSGW